RSQSRRCGRSDPGRRQQPDGSGAGPRFLSLAGGATGDGFRRTGREQTLMMRGVQLAIFLAAGCLLGAPCAALAQTAIPMQKAAAGNDAPRQPIAWSSLSSVQQHMLAPLQGQWEQMKPGRQQHLAQNAERWATLPPAHQQQIRERLARWAAMTPEERRQLRENARAFRDLTPEERAKVSAAFRK